MHAAYIFLFIFVSSVFCQAEFCKTIEEPCEQKACALACAECESGCIVLESFPVQYSCENPSRTFSVYDVCPDFNPFPSFEIPPTETESGEQESNHGDHGHGGGSHEHGSNDEHHNHSEHGSNHGNHGSDDSHEHHGHSRESHEHGSNDEHHNGHHGDNHGDNFSSASVVTVSVVALFLVSIAL